MRWQQVSLTLLLIALSIVVSLLIGFGQNRGMMAWFTLTRIGTHGIHFIIEPLGAMLASFQWWRLLTPVFMHFSELHLIFNLLWVWVAGSRIEVLQGRWVLAGLVVFSGISSNLAQFWVSGPLFGGMSGVVFALLAYTWLWDKQSLWPRFNLPPALMGFMLVWLVLGYSGLLQGMGLGAIANTAHLAGLLAGLVYVYLVRACVKPVR